MIGSLRVRLLLLTAAVVAIALGAAAVVSRVAVKMEYQRLVTRDRGRDLERAADLVTERLRRTGAEAVSDSALAALARSLDQDLALVAPDGRVLAASAPELREARVSRGAGGRMVITNRVRRAGGVQTRRARSTRGGPSAGRLAARSAPPVPARAGRVRASGAGVPDRGQSLAARRGPRRRAPRPAPHARPLAAHPGPRRVAHARRPEARGRRPRAARLDPDG